MSDLRLVGIPLAAYGALAIAFVLPSPDHAVPGLWAAVWAASIVGHAGSASARQGLALGVWLGATLCAVAAAWWALGGWLSLGAGAVALAVGAALVARSGGSRSGLARWYADQWLGRAP